MDLGLKNKVILVTGGGAGIGEGITRACVAEGARVVVLSRESENVRHCVASLKEAGADIALIPTNLQSVEECRSAIEQVQRTYDHVFGLVNNAGVNDGVGLASGSPERFEESLRMNLQHYYTLAQLCLPMLRASKGSIVNISSKVALTGQGNTSGYAASKGAQLALTREWAAELLADGIRVNAILPAEVMTPLYQRWLQTLPSPDTELARIQSRIPLGHRMTTIEEIGAAAAFLLSPTQSGHTTGQHLIVDGGYTHLDRALT